MSESDDNGPPMMVIGGVEAITDADDNEDDEEIYSRGRSRSRSMHSCDESQNASTPPGALDASTNNVVISGKSNENSTPPRVAERTGPLQHREVVALKKGLEEQTQSRNKDQVREEEEEKRAAVVEKQSRGSITSTNAKPAMVGTDPPMRRVKILMLGDSGVGKSSLINRWTLDQFNPTLVSTVGVDFKAKKVALDGESYNVQVWDTAGQEHFHKITLNYYKGANGIMLVFDVSDKQSLDNIEYWIKNIKKHALDSVHVALIGNKTDLRSSAGLNGCDMNAGRNIAKKFGVPYFETSAKESINVDEAYKTVLRSIVGSESTVGNNSNNTMSGTKKSTITQKMEKNNSNSIFSFGKKDKKEKERNSDDSPMSKEEKDKCKVS